MTVTSVLGFGIIIGMGLASCASSSPERGVASESGARYVSSQDEKEVKPKECMVGEQRNEDGDCVRPHNFDRPFRRGGR